MMRLFPRRQTGENEADEEDEGDEEPDEGEDCASSKVSDHRVESSELTAGTEGGDPQRELRGTAWVLLCKEGVVLRVVKGQL